MHLLRDMFTPICLHISLIKLLIYLHTVHVLDLCMLKHLYMEIAFITCSEIDSVSTHWHTFILLCGLLHSAHLFLRCM